jgi:hypothetical protein
MLRPSGYAWRCRPGEKGEACPAKLERSESEDGRIAEAFGEGGLAAAGL